MKRIISYSLWGNEPMYTIGAIRNAEMSPKVFPEWTCRFYLGSDVSIDIVNKLKSFGHTEVFVMENKPNDWQGMFWRFYPINTEEDIDIMISRDTDSRLSNREALAVE